MRAGKYMDRNILRGIADLPSLTEMKHMGIPEALLDVVSGTYTKEFSRIRCCIEEITIIACEAEFLYGAR